MADRREGDWNCVACDAHNFANRTACFKCKANKDGSPSAPAVRRPRNNRPARASRPVETREGDWNCSECDAHNFASRARCFKCRNPRADVQAALDAGATPWVCSSCGGNNFADRTTCFKCHEPRTDDATVAAEVVPRARRRNRNNRRDLRAGDWICSECGDHQFASRTECRECGNPKSETDVVSQEDAMRPGDWMCPACNDHQFASRMECRACGEARPDGIPAAPVKKTVTAVADDDEGMWVCSCDAENEASALTCKDCGAEKVEF